MNDSALSTRLPRRGAATLALTVTLFFALLLTVIYVNRNLVFEQRSATHLVHSTQAFEAAEAGLSWLTAQLDSGTPIDSACQPAGTSAATSLRERMLRTDPVDGHIRIATWDDAGVATPLQAACVRSANGWSCSCPAAGAPVLSLPADAASAPAFRIELVALPQPGMLRAVAAGCTSLAGDCAPGANTASEASARVTVDLALLPALKSAPAAALTARGAISAAAGTLLRNADIAAGGIAVHAGGALGSVQIEGPAGTPASAASVSNDASLAAQTGDTFFVSYFGMPHRVWTAQAVVKTLRCEGDCGVELRNLVDGGNTPTLVHAPGSLRLSGPLVLGSAQRPVLLVADGEVQLQGDVTVHGVIYSRSLRWDGTTSSAAQWHGAVITEGDFGGSATPTITRDAAVLVRLQTQGGSVVPIGGSWRDF